MMVKIPAMSDEILTNQYGYYMTPPSKEKQVPGHGLSFLIDIRGDQNEQ